MTPKARTSWSRSSLWQRRSGDNEIGLRDPDGRPARIIETSTNCEAYFRASVSSNRRPNRLSYGFIISNARGIEVYGTKSGALFQVDTAAAAGASYECRLRFNVRLVPGRYFLTAALAHEDDRSKDQFLDYRFDAFEFEVIGPTRTFTSSLTDLNAELTHSSLTEFTDAGLSDSTSSQH